MKHPISSGHSPEFLASVDTLCGTACTAAEKQMYLREMEIFKDLFGRAPAVFTSTPGRICLIGEHVDYFGGDVVTAAINNFITIYIRLRSDDAIHLDNINEKFPSYTTRLPLINERSVSGGEWHNYVLTVFYLVSEHLKGRGRKIQGMDVLVGGDMAFAAGLSSSAALQVGVGAALDKIYDLNLQPEEIAILAQDSEVLCNQDSGIMDQMAVVNAVQGRALIIDCMTPAVADSFVVPSNLLFVAFTTGIKANKAESEYNLRIAGGLYALKTILLQLTNHGMRKLPGFKKDILEIISLISSGENLESLLRHGCSLKTIYTMAEQAELPLSTREILDLLPRELSMVTLNKAGITIGGRFWGQKENIEKLKNFKFKIRNYIRHAFSEMDRTRQFLHAFRDNDFIRAGRLLNETHGSLVHDYEVGWEEGDIMVRLANEFGAYGARQVGAGFGGSVLALVERDKAGELVAKVTEQYLKETGVKPTSMLVSPGHGTIGGRLAAVGSSAVPERRAIVRLLLEKGVVFPEGVSSVTISDSVDPNAIEAGVVLHRGCIIEGEKTVLRQGAELGLVAGGYFKNITAGKNVKLQGGYFEDAVFLDNVTVRSGAEIRGGTLLCEHTEVAQSAGLKMTIALGYCFFGSVVNFCDAFLQAGRSREFFTEVGSGAINFNNTMHYIKFPSLIGDVSSLLFENDLIFVGGASKIIAPRIIHAGSVIAAGSRVSHDVQACRLYSEAMPDISREFTSKKMANIPDKVLTVLRYMANLHVLKDWFISVRNPFDTGYFEKKMCDNAIRMIEINLQERITWLRKIVESFNDPATREILKDSRLLGPEIKESSSKRKFIECLRQKYDNARSFPENIHCLGSDEKALGREYLSQAVEELL